MNLVSLSRLPLLSIHPSLPHGTLSHKGGLQRDCDRVALLASTGGGRQAEEVWE